MPITFFSGLIIFSCCLLHGGDEILCWLGVHSLRPKIYWGFFWFLSVISYPLLHCPLSSLPCLLLFVPGKLAILFLEDLEQEVCVTNFSPSQGYPKVYRQPYLPADKSFISQPVAIWCHPILEVGGGGGGGNCPTNLTGGVPLVNKRFTMSDRSNGLPLSNAFFFS